MDVAVRLMDQQGPNYLLLKACTFNYLDSVKFLLSQGTDVQCVDQNQATPLHLASSNGNLEIVKYLVKMGANLHSIDKDQATPLHYACYSGQWKTIKYLITQGADLYCLDKDKRSPLQIILVTEAKVSNDAK